jgi:hypothetical protein
VTVQEIKAIIEKLRGWYANLYNQSAPETRSAWQPSRLDHRFALKVDNPGEKTTLIAPDYRNGDFDWYSCSAQSSAPKLSGEIRTEHFTPTRVCFGGMPHPRWWAFEAARTYFGDLDVEKPDLVKLMLMEFALVYGDDWFVIPLQVMANSLTQIVSLKAYDVFNDVVNTPSTKGLTIYPPDASKIEISGAPWNVFRLSTRTGVLKDVLYIPPATGFREESPPLEEVRFIRDEGANMVWAIEHKVLNQLGTPIDGFDAQRERQDREEE